MSHAIWTLRVMVCASVLGPILLFGYASWATYRTIVARTGERLERALDVVHEHAGKAFQTIDRAIAETDEVLRGLTDEQVAAREEQLSRRLKRTTDALSHVEAIWVFGRDGHPLVSSSVYPVPRTIDNRDRDYFAAQTERDAGTYVGEVVTSRIGNIRFFVVSQRRPSEDGSFAGVTAVSVYPAHFRDFYARTARGIADSISLLRADGKFLVRYPFHDEGRFQLNGDSVFAQALRTNPEAGRFRAVSQIDCVARDYGYRRVAGTSLYVQAGIEADAARAEVIATMAPHLLFGIPATLLLFGLSLFALRRTEGFDREVRRREQAEAALKQAQRLEAIGELTGGVAHDFNNLLMVVGGNAERLRRLVRDERAPRYLDAVDSAVKHGASLTRQLLSFARRQAHEAVPIDLAQRLRSIRDMLRSSLRGDIELNIAVPEGTRAVKVDVSECELALLNLAVNARDAMPKGGRLAVSARNARPADLERIGLEGDFVVVSVSDDGEGIRPEHLGRVFNPFFTTKGAGKGTGLGLSQVYGFARQSGGTATIDSRVGSGTTVSLYLPGTDEAVPAGEPRASETDEHRTTGRVLVVEDSPEVAAVASAALVDAGYAVVHASSAHEALNVLEKGAPFSLILSDILMPGGMTGVELAHVIRRLHQVPIVLMTGYGGATPVGADVVFLVLRKPFTAAALIEAAGAAIRSFEDRRLGREGAGSGHPART